MKPYSLTFLLASLMLCFFSTQVSAAKIFMWKDSEGIKQFSNKPPSKQCQTDSCRKIHSKIKRQLHNKKEAEIALIQAREEQQALAQERKKEKQESLLREKSKQHFLPKASILCKSLNNIKEYQNVQQARRFLEKDEQCYSSQEKIEYTLIDSRKDFTQIRIYLTNGTSEQKWIKSSTIE